MAADEADFMRKAGGNAEKAMGVLVLDLTRDMAQTLRLNENFVLKKLIAYALKKGRSRLKKATRLARCGH